MRKIFLCLSFSIGIGAAMAQEQVPQEQKPQEQNIFFEKPKPLWQQKLRYGGNFWLQFWGSLYADVSPMIGYELNNKGTVAGLGGTLIYQGGINGSGGTAAFGFRPFVRQQVFKQFFAQAEFEVMNATANNFYPVPLSQTGQVNDVHRKWGASPLVGLGFYQSNGKRGSYIALMYNLGAPSSGFISPQSLSSAVPVSIRIGFF